MKIVPNRMEIYVFSKMHMTKFHFVRHKNDRDYDVYYIDINGVEGEGNKRFDGGIFYSWLTSVGGYKITSQEYYENKTS